MKKIFAIIIFTICAIFSCGFYSFLLSKERARGATGSWLYALEQGEKKSPGEKKDPDRDDDLDMEDREFDIEEREDKKLESELEKDTRQYVSLRKKKETLTFHVGFSIGGIGYGVVGGPRESLHGLYRLTYITGAFQFGFRGAIEGMFYLNRDHCLSLGASYEQRKPEIKINYVPLSGFLLAQSTIEYLYLYLGAIDKYLSRSIVTLNYLTLPVTYRYHVTEEFYVGAGLDIGLLMQGKTTYSVFLFKSKLNLKNMLAPVDLGGRVVLGFAMSNVFIEAGVGAGILKLDTMRGDRRSMYLTAIVGYRI